MEEVGVCYSDPTTKWEPLEEEEVVITLRIAIHSKIHMNEVTI